MYVQHIYNQYLVKGSFSIGILVTYTGFPLQKKSDHFDLATVRSSV